MNVALILSYDGGNYSGYQIQPNKKTIQEELEKALFAFYKKEIKTTASGRTDAFVSATNQVVSFEVEKLVPAEKLKFILNDMLPMDIRVVESKEVDSNFNARFSAKSKTYEYHFYFNQTQNAYLDKTASFFKGNLNIDEMKKAASQFIGTFDFSAFCASNTEVKDKIRTIFDCKIENINEELNEYKLIISGSGFLYNMVRIIMGTLVNVGYGKISYKDIKKIIKSCNRKNAGITVEAHGLVLVKVEY